jgi:hypothetical protein
MEYIVIYLGGMLITAITFCFDEEESYIRTIPANIIYIIFWPTFWLILMFMILFDAN